MRGARAIALLLLLTAPGFVGCAEPHAGPAEITVLAAASMTDAVEALADSFEAAHPRYRVVHGVAATSLLARQIERGIRADVFISANVEWMDHLLSDGRIAGVATELLGNRLVVAGRADAAPLASLAALGRVSRLAVADPEHVPAGMYAREGLMCAGIWDAVSHNLVPTIDVRAALVAVRSGAADMAIVYASDMLVAPALAVLLAWPKDCAPEIRYTVARLRSAPNPQGAKLFRTFAADPARAVLWSRFGFDPLPAR